MMFITSPDFEPHGRIPDRYTCEDQNVNPTLFISEVPPNTQSLAVIIDDVDSITPEGPFTHWVIWNIKPSYTTIGDNSVPEGAAQGLNSAGKIGYMGPCPPPTQPHHYRIMSFALTDKLNLPEGSSKIDVEIAMEGKILAQAELIGEYSRI